jgi:hypothetical protein
MSKEWITTAEAAQLLEVDGVTVRKHARRGALEAKQNTTAHGKPWLYKRASVVEYRDARRKSANTDLLDKSTPKAKRVKARVIKLYKQPPREATQRARASQAGTREELAADVRTLVHCVRRGWLTPGQLLDQLEKLV